MEDLGRMAEVKERRIELRASPFCCELALGVGGSTCKARMMFYASFIIHLSSFIVIGEVSA